MHLTDPSIYDFNPERDLIPHDFLQMVPSPANFAFSTLAASGPW
jgi:hypothetical protein